MGHTIESSFTQNLWLNARYFFNLWDINRTPPAISFQGQTPVSPPQTVKDTPFLLAPLTIVRRSLSDTNLSSGIRQLFQIATSPTFFNGFF